MNCKCGIAAKMLEVKKPGPNQGRQMYKCGNYPATCDIFVFADGQPPKRNPYNTQPYGGAPQAPQYPTQAPQAQAPYTSQYTAPVPSQYRAPQAPPPQAPQPPAPMQYAGEEDWASKAIEKSISLDSVLEKLDAFIDLLMLKIVSSQVTKVPDSPPRNTQPQAQAPQK